MRPLSVANSLQSTTTSYIRTIAKQVARTEALSIKLFLKTACHLREIHQSLSCICLLRQEYSCTVLDSLEVAILLSISL